MDRETGFIHLRVKAGSVEIEYEGDSAFAEEHVLDTVRAIVADRGNLSESHGGGAAMGNSENSAPPSPKFENYLSTSEIAGKLHAKSCSELASAAAASLTFFGDRDTFTRHELLAEMRTVKSVFTPHMPGNLWKALQTLKKKQVLHESAKDVFALKPKARQELEVKIAGN